ncbi:hypothetical protein AAG747_25465 [Rapidithrix thailandica]|uniref:Transcriptional regulator n=1 Tax=Rapidithrix thailandica TaxID=413964 RepID=A0AAW9S2A3_9BACT
MKIEILKTREDYENAIRRLEDVFDAPDDTPEADEAALLILLIEDYEDRYLPVMSRSSFSLWKWFVFF